ncbi:Y-family DNA polymerase [Tepidamorphus sp. 3E244]|uniref:Y-family DNA polymerase n=1 Tax=Tepidamorphus sp. 3E244 TaxID=3385498 RepID=UPI0038FCA49C
MTNANSGPSRRYLAVWFPFLPRDRHAWQARRCNRPVETPLCFTTKERGALRISAVDPAAADLGIAAGMKLADARAQLPRLAAIDHDTAADQGWLERLGTSCDRYTPMASIAGTDGLILDISGCAHLFGGEEALRANLLAWLSRHAAHVRTHIAGTPHAADAQARFGAPGITPSGGEAQAASPLPVEALCCEAEAVTALRRAGLKTLGDLACRPRSVLAARFGKEAVSRLARILGEEDIGITPRRPLPPLSLERRLAEPIADVDTVLDIIGQLATGMADELRRRGEGGRRFAARLFRVDGHVTTLEVETARASRDADAVMRLFHERIETMNQPLEPGYGFDLVRLATPAVEQMDARQNSLDGHAEEDDAVSDLVDRLVTRLGREAVLEYGANQSHLPERAASEHAADTHGTNRAQWITPRDGEAPLRPVHLFRRPEPIETLAQIPDGPPLRFRWRRVLHEVARGEGPERIAPEWWQPGEDIHIRDYYRLEDSQGRRFWVYREGTYEDTRQPPRWYMHGLFA